MLIKPRRKIGGHGTGNKQRNTIYATVVVMMGR